MNSNILLAYDSTASQYEPLQLDTNNRLKCTVDSPLEVSLDYLNDSVECYQNGVWNVNSTIQNSSLTVDCNNTQVQVSSQPALASGTDSVSAVQSGTWSVDSTIQNASLTVDCNNTQVQVSSQPALASGTDSVTAVQSGTWNVNSTIQNSSLTVDCNGSDVSVLNFPATQPVSGTVNVGNFPAVQSVSGTVTRGITKYTGALATDLLVSGSTDSSSVDVTSMRDCQIVYRGNTVGVNTNASAINIECSYDDSVWNEMSDKIYLSQSTTNTNRAGSIHLSLGGIKFIKLNMSDSETANAKLFGVD